MLLSELQERSRRFKLALRAGIPILVLIFLVLYSTFYNGTNIAINLKNTAFIAALLFITVYFIYFLMELSAKETLIDQTTQGYNEKAFLKQLKDNHPKILALLMIENISTIRENYSLEEVDLLLYTLVHKLNHALNKAGFSKALIARRQGTELLIAIDEKSEIIQKFFDNFTKENKKINSIELNYRFSIVENIENVEKSILYLKDLISVQARIPNSHSTRKDAKELSETESCVIASLKNKNLILQFRPLLNTKTNAIDIYEISVKMHSEKLGNILPRVYLPIVNRLGLGREYDLALLEHVVNIAALIPETISLSFNLSPFSLRDEVFQEKLFDAVAKSAMDPSRLIIELYERKTHHDLSSYLQTLNKFRARGMRIAIDNFGSSNASMEYMKNFKFDLIQFDRDYVTKLQDKNTRAMLSSLVKMSKDLQIITVAKWVDNEAQKTELKALGIDYMQGFGIAKPISEQTVINTYN